MPFGPDYRAQLAQHDRHWIWKIAFRLLIIVFDLVAIGLLAWAIADGMKADNSDDRDSYYNSFYYSTYLELNYIALGASLIWCTVALVVHLGRKKEAHPGVAVGLDLCLWIAFVIFAAFTLLLSVDNATYQTRHVARRSKRGAAELAAATFLIVNFMLHFTVFVWACIDTSAYNSKKYETRAKDIADAMIAQMIANGQLAPPQQPLLYSTQSLRDSQPVSQPGTRGNSGMYNGAHPLERRGPVPGPSAQPSLQQIQQMEHMQQMQHIPQHWPITPHQPPRRPQSVPVSPAKQTFGGSEPEITGAAEIPPNGDASGGGNTDSPRTPPSELSEAERQAVDEADGIKPAPPVRAPGHTYSSSGSLHAM